MVPRFSMFPHSIGIAGLLLALGGQAFAQQSTIGMPFQSAGDSFYESFGFSGSLSGPNWFANWGGALPPPLGLGVAETPAFSGGVGVGGNGWNGRFGFTASQGFSRASTSEVPSVTLMNGGSAVFGEQTFSPFVLGLVPVVGDFSVGPGGLPWKQQMDGFASLRESTPEPAAAVDEPVADDENEDRAEPALKLAAPDEAEQRPARGTPGRSVAAVRRQQQAEESAEEQAAREKLAQAREAVAAGKPAIARIYLKQAARRATGDLLKQIEGELKRLED